MPTKKRRNSPACEDGAALSAVDGHDQRVAVLARGKAHGRARPCSSLLAQRSRMRWLTPHPRQFGAAPGGERMGLRISRYDLGLGICKPHARREHAKQMDEVGRRWFRHLARAILERTSVRESNRRTDSCRASNRKGHHHAPTGRRSNNQWQEPGPCSAAIKTP